VTDLPQPDSPRWPSCPPSSKWNERPFGRAVDALGGTEWGLHVLDFEHASPALAIHESSASRRPSPTVDASTVTDRNAAERTRCMALYLHSALPFGHDVAPDGMWRRSVRAE